MNEIKQEDEIYCPECGKAIKRNAVICINCGVQLKELKTSLKQEIVFDSSNSKSKTTAVILAIFLGFWSWLYTYKKDYKKFWIYLGIILIGATGFGILINKYPSTLLVNYGTWIWLYFLIIQSSYVWVLINSIGRPNSFYTNYPNEYVR